MTPWLPPYWPNVSFCIFAKLNKPQIKAFRKALWPATALKSIPAHSSDNFISDPVAHTLQSVWMKYVLHLATDWNTNYARCESLSLSLSRLNTITLATPHWTSAPPSRCLQPVQWLIAKCLNLIFQGNNLYTHHHPLSIEHILSWLEDPIALSNYSIIPPSISPAKTKVNQSLHAAEELSIRIKLAERQINRPVRRSGSSVLRAVDLKIKMCEDKKESLWHVLPSARDLI